MSSQPGSEAAETAGQRADHNEREEGPRRSARLAVPKPETSISLGCRVPGTTIKVDGFGLDTVGQGYLNACGQIGVQAAGLLSLQSTGHAVRSLARRDQIIAAGGNAYLYGRGGVLIATVDDDPTAVDADTNMPLGTGMEKARDDAGVAAKTIAAFNDYVGSAPKAREGRDGQSNQGSYHPFAGWKPLISDFDSFGQAAVQAVTSPTTVGVDGEAAKASVTLFGLAGVIQSTPGFGGLYAGRALVMASPSPLMLGDTPELLGLKTAAVTGVERATLQSDDAVAVHGQKSVTVDTEGGGRIDTRSTTYETEAMESACVRVGDFRILVTEKQVDIAKRSGSDNSADPTKPQVVVRDEHVKIAVGGTEITVTKDSITIKDHMGGQVTVGQGAVAAQDATQQAKIGLQSGETKIGGLSLSLSAPVTKVNGQMVNLG